MTERFWELLAKYWGADISKEEKAELEQLLLEHPDYWLKAGIAGQLSYKAAPLLTDKDLESLADKIAAGIGEEEIAQDLPAPDRKRTGRRKFLARLTIVVVLCVGIICIMRYKYPQTDTAIPWKKITTIPGTRTSIILADGSTIWLNAGSTLRYPENFNEKQREVYLSGEAYFKVKHHADKPFIIHTDKMVVKDLGTEFDVRAYPDESFSETSLIKGAVEVDISEGSRMQKILLKPHQKIIVKDKETALNEMQKGIEPDRPAEKDTAYDNVILKTLKPFEGVEIPETAWKADKLVFQDEPFELLAARLERWYGVKITIKDPQIAQQCFTGRADNVSLEKLLMILQQIEPFRYSINGQEVIIQKPE